MSEEQKEAISKAKEAERDAAEAAAKKENDSRSGVGTRKFVGFTRGKGSMLVTWEQFDDSLPETLPKDLQNFIEVTKTNADDLLVYAIKGYNETMYTAASDPLAEYVESHWPEAAKTQFRLVTRNYSRGANVPLEKAVELIKPGFEAQFPAASAAK